MSNEIRRKTEMKKAKNTAYLNTGLFALPLRYDDFQKHTGKHKKGL